MFRAAHEKSKNDKPFQKSDPLVSIRDKEIKVSINNKPILNIEVFERQTKILLNVYINHTNKEYENYADHIQLALNILANPSFTNGDGQIDKNIDIAIKNLNELKENILLTGYKNPDITDHNRKKKEFNKIVDRLITTLENAKKT